MTNVTDSLLVFSLPHLFSRVDLRTKERYKETYKLTKRSVIAGSGAIVATIDGKQLVKDILSSKLRAYGYKSFFAVVLGPALGAFSIPFYVLSQGGRVRSLAFGLAELSAKIIACQMTIADWLFIVPDLMFFGEPVSVIETKELMLYSNETFGILENSINSVVNYGI